MVPAGSIAAAHFARRPRLWLCPGLHYVRRHRNQMLDLQGRNLGRRSSPGFTPQRSGATPATAARSPRAPSAHANAGCAFRKQWSDRAIRSAGFVVRLEARADFAAPGSAAAELEAGVEARQPSAGRIRCHWGAAAGETGIIFGD